eukprot:scaffold251881_cov24-Tisochrysis_lutea.AAC.1
MFTYANIAVPLHPCLQPRFCPEIRLSLPNASTSAHFSSARDGREARKDKGRTQHSRQGPKSQFAALPPQQDLFPSQHSPQGLQRMLSSFPAKLTPAHLHSVLAWAIDHYEQQGATRVWKGGARNGQARSSVPQTVHVPLREGRRVLGSAQMQHEEHGLMEGEVFTFESSCFLLCKAATADLPKQSAM